MIFLLVVLVLVLLSVGYVLWFIFTGNVFDPACKADFREHPVECVFDWIVQVSLWSVVTGGAVYAALKLIF